MPKKIYGVATVGERGQIVIPAGARRELGIKSGESFLFRFADRDDADLELIRAERFLKKVKEGISRDALGQVIELLQKQVSK